VREDERRRENNEREIREGIIGEIPSKENEKR